MSAPGLILFSSGSTGASKAALLDFDKLLLKFQKPRPVFRTLTFLLLDHIGGINTLFYVLSQGGTVVPAVDRDPWSVCRSIERHQIELLPTTPTFLKMLLISEAYLHHDCSSLRLITYGTEPMSSTTLTHLHAALPKRGVEADVRALRVRYPPNQVAGLRVGLAQGRRCRLCNEGDR